MAAATRGVPTAQHPLSSLLSEFLLGIYQNGAFVLRESNPDAGVFRYEVDGSYGDYTTQVKITGSRVDLPCSCPYPGNGCKHAVAALLDTRDILLRWKSAAADETAGIAKEPCLLRGRAARRHAAGEVQAGSGDSGRSPAH